MKFTGWKAIYIQMFDARPKRLRRTAKQLQDIRFYAILFYNIYGKESLPKT